MEEPPVITLCQRATAMTASCESPESEMRVLYRRSHGDRMIEVLEDDQSRTLAFDSHLTQSRMAIDDPNRLLLRYTRRMMAGLLFSEAAAGDEPFRVLMVGLGGGSVAKFLLHHFPACRMDVVEDDPRLPDLARRYFHLPRDVRLNVICEDGASFLDRRESSTRYDLILLDAFDQNGAAPGVYAEPMFDLAQGRLTPWGVLIVNVLRSDRNLFQGVTTGLSRRFPDATLGLSVPGFSNEILFAGPGVPAWERRKSLTGRARTFEMRLGLNFPSYLDEMARLERYAPWRRWFGISS
ncbi:MAG: fused MFS/spermidine synthase [Magnetococcales bacterium]|nr:fused MFS/spermidine synthase [Magnetococcales bacterium]